MNGSFGERVWGEEREGRGDQERRGAREEGRQRDEYREISSLKTNTQNLFFHTQVASE